MVKESNKLSFFTYIMDKNYKIETCNICNGLGKKEWIEKSFCTPCNGTGKVVQITCEGITIIKEFNG